VFHPSSFAQVSEVVIRRASAADDQALSDLAALDGHALPPGRDRLVGELAGRVVAAVDVRSGTTVADPFFPTAAVTDLLGLRARQVRS
jgi:hypothetical protein